MTIDTIQIKNFKSIVDLQLDLGIFNVLIGENGSGKSNILEAIAFGAAASADKLDYEFFGSRGIRVANPEFMFPAFVKKEVKSLSVLDYDIGELHYKYAIGVDPHNSKKWINHVDRENHRKLATQLFKGSDLSRDLENNTFWKFLSEEREDISRYRNLAKQLKEVVDDDKTRVELFIEFLRRDLFSNDAISDFVIYSPEQSSLRRFEDTAQIYPLGIRGEGLFQYLKEISLDPKDHEMLERIKNSLLLLDWYEDFRLPENLMNNEFSLQIKDKYLDPTLQYFDQRSTNEGFLFLLFYFTLFTSKLTPTFFAIDNIDASFNPKLCVRLIQSLINLAKEYGKQVIVTTQNPAVLDGLTLGDKDQRLFVVRRNDEGHTKVSRIPGSSERRMKLSEVWLGGYIGGLPENF